MAKAHVYYLQPRSTRKAAGRQRGLVVHDAGIAIPGLRYVPRFLSEAVQSFLLARIDAEAWMHDIQRRTQHYGYRYDYKARCIDSSMYLGPLPAWLQPLADRLAAQGHMDAVPDQVIANEYLPEQGITPHVDCVPCFGPTICSISLGSMCLMDFTEKTGERTTSLRLDRGTLLVLRDDARYAWKHAIAKRKTDTINGNMFHRGRRVSLTFRRVVSGY